MSSSTIYYKEFLWVYKQLSDSTRSLEGGKVQGSVHKDPIFLRTTAQECLPTMDRLCKHGFYLPGVCLPCYSSGESTNHIRIHCPFTQEIWCRMLKDFSLCFTALSNMTTLLEGWRTSALNSIGMRSWHPVLAVVCLLVWLERNNRVKGGLYIGQGIARVMTTYIMGLL